MANKVAFVLLAVALMAQCDAFKLNDGAFKLNDGAFKLNDDAFKLNDESSLPGFSYLSIRKRLASINATEGSFVSNNVIFNSTRWRPVETAPSSKAISQNITIPDISAIYPNSKAHFAQFRETGTVRADLSIATAKITLKASGAIDQCELQGTISFDLHPEIDLDDLDYVGGLLENFSGEMEGVTKSVAESLENPLPPKVDNMAREVLASKTDLNVLCKELLDSTPKNYPEPLFY